MVTRKKTTFKQRLRRNGMKERTRFTSQLRERMGAARHNSNRNDRREDGSRPLTELIADIAEGTAVASYDPASLDPRSLTDLLLNSSKSGSSSSGHNGKENKAEGQPATEPESAVGDTSASKSKKKVGESSGKYALPSELPEELAALDEAVLSREEQRRRQAREQELRSASNENKNLYRHHGQAYLFWSRVGLHTRLIDALKALRFTHPTPVQEEVLPSVLCPELVAEAEEDKKKKKKLREAATEARDVIVSAETGSGKTLVFALPVLNAILRRLEEQGQLLSDEELQNYLQQQASLASALEEEEKKKDEAKGGVTRKGKKRPRSASVHDDNDDDGGGDGDSNCNSKKKGKKRAVEKSSSASSSGSVRVARIQPVLLQKDDFQRRLMHTLVISPTRELALQINGCFKDLTRFCPEITVGCVVGGMAAEKQQRVLNRHPHVLICTPGRLWELVQKNEGCYLGHSISRRLQYIVLDEADKMLQSGRFEELKSLLDRIHCDVLPAGFGQEREEGAENEEMDVEAGKWDPVTEKFIPYTKEELQQQREKKKTTSTPKTASEKKKSKEESGKAKKGKKGRRSEPEEAEEIEEDEDDEENDDDDGDESHAPAHPKMRKDQPQPIPMPPDVAEDHRVVTFVTSATLSLQTNYERRDFKSNKSIIRTSNADVMGKVLQQLEIKPSQASVFTVSAQANVAATINETYLRCPDDSRDLYMYYFLKTYSDDRTIIFVNAISMLRRLVKLLVVLGIKVVGLHASMQQRQRLKFIEKFRRGDIRVLVATDVASRGLDIDGLKYVVHYQVPRTTDAYIHRCGRTARCGGTGLSMLLVNAQEHMSFRKLMESLGRKESDMEVFAVQPTVVHQLHQHLRIARQIDKLQKEIDKSSARNRWVKRMSDDAELDTDDMYDEELSDENRAKAKAIKVLQKELHLLTTKFTGSFGGKGAFRTGAIALGAQEAEKKLKERADRQTLRLKKGKKR